MGLTDFFFGGNKANATSTLTGGQRNQLAGLTGLNTQYNPRTFQALAGLAYNPESTYTGLQNWEENFQQGVQNPVFRQLSQQIGNTQHSSNLHSSANRYAQDKLRQDTMDYLSGQRYNQMNTERGLQMQGAESARNSQLAALQQLAGLSGQGLNINAVENTMQKKPGLFDWINGLGNTAGTIGTLIG